MQIAIEQAKLAFQEEEIPVGCVIVLNNEIIAKSYNRNRQRDCNIYHAEMIAIEEACQKVGRLGLTEATMYVTLEPCLMCCGAIIQSRIKKLVYGVNEDRFGACESVLNTFELKSNHKVIVQSGICKEEIEELMKKFFIQMRSKK